MATSEDVLKTLQSIDATLKAMLAASKANRAATVAQAIDPAVASDADLDSQYGDPEVRVSKPIRGYVGESMKGRKFSECPPDYLDALASLFDWAATQESDEKTKGHKLKDAARARGWARRLRSGWKPAEVATSFGDDDIPF